MSPWNLRMCDPRWKRGVTLETGHVTPGAVPETWGHTGDWMCEPGTRNGRGVNLETVDV